MEEVPLPLIAKVCAAVLPAVLAGCAAARIPAAKSPPRSPLVVSASAKEPRDVVGVVPRSVGGDAPIATVAGSEIRRSDLGAFVIRYFRDQANEALTQLIDERVIDAEAGALGVTLPKGLLDRELDAEIAKRERTVKAQFGPDVTLKEYLSNRYGVTLAEHRKNLRHLLRIRALRDRVIRLDELRETRVQVRDAAFRDLASARSAASAARRGADLSALAKESGLRPATALPPIPESELSPPALAKAVCALVPGAVSDPIAVEKDGGTVYHVFKMIQVLPARDVTWKDAEREIERGIRKRPVEKWEYAQWSRQMKKKYRVRVLR